MNLPRAVIRDRRAHDRHPIHVGAVLVLPGGRTVPARTLDLGEGGTGVVSDANVPIGTKVELHMTLPARPSGSARFVASATVVNCTLAAADGGFRTGLQFAPLSPAALDALRGALPA